MKFGYTKYVRTSGNDSNTGGIADPFLTIQKAISVSTGKTKIDVGSGTFTEAIDFSATTATFIYIHSKSDTTINISSMIEDTADCIFKDGTINLNGGWA